MAVRTEHQSKIISRYEEKTDSEKLEVLEKAWKVKEVISYYDREECICRAMGYKLYSCSDNTWYRE